MATKVNAYLLTLKIGGKIISGLETTGFKIKPNFDDILLKENAGSAVKEFVDYDTEMSFSGRTYEGDLGVDQDFETLRQAAAAGTQVAFTYGRFTTGAQQVTGYGWITDHSEEANSESKPGTFSGTLTGKKGSITFGAQA